MVPNGSGGLQMVSGEWLLVVVDGFEWLRMILRGFEWFAVLVATVTIAVLFP